MKILLFYHALELGGVGSVVANQVNWWAQNGVEVTLALFTNSTAQHHHALRSEIKVLHLDLFSSTPSLKKRAFSALHRHWTIRKTVKDTAPDVIVSHVDTVNIRVLLSITGLNVPVVAMEHTDPTCYTLGPLWGNLRKITYRRLAKLVTLNQHTFDYFSRFMPRDTVTILPNPIPTPSSTTKSEQEQTILYVGRLSEEKGGEVLIRAFARANPPNWHLLLAGDGPQMTTLSALTRDLGMIDTITFLGAVKNVPTLLGKAGMFILPSMYEGFPMALGEAMVSGVACIATETQGSKALITDGINGLLTPIGDVQSLADTIRRLTLDDTLRETLGNEARKVTNLVGIDAVMTRWTSLLQSVIDAR